MVSNFKLKLVKCWSATHNHNKDDTTTKTAHASISRKILRQQLLCSRLPSYAHSHIHQLLGFFCISTDKVQFHTATAPGLEKIMIFNKKSKKSDFFDLNQIFFI